MKTHAILLRLYDFICLPFELFGMFSGLVTPKITEQETATQTPSEPKADNEITTVSIKALNALGWPKKDANALAREILSENPDATVEQVVKIALKTKRR